MAFDWMRRGVLALTAGAALAVAGCGSSSIVGQFAPVRMFAFGDNLTDVGNRGEYSVNDGGVDVWVQQVALDYGFGVSPSSTGGNDFAWGNARISVKPDAAGDATTPTMKEQIDTFLAATTPTARDLIYLGGGTSDILAEVTSYRAGTQTSDQMLANIRQAARDYATQAKRLVAAGASHVVILPPYDLSETALATAISSPDLLHTASAAFSTELLLDIEDQGANMLYVDSQLLFNLIANNPASYGLVSVTQPVCTSVDPGPGVGLGAGQINSAKCTASTLLSGQSATQYLWADLVYPTPIGHQRFGDYVFQRTTARW